MAKYYRKYVRKKKKSPYLIVLILIIVSVLSIVGVHFLKKKITQKKENANYISNCDHVKYASAPISPSSKLNDPNETQLIHAMKNGLKTPFITNNEFIAKLDSLKRNQILEEVTENKFYQLKELTHSQPYLIPEAVDMLNEIGYRFQKRLEEKKRDCYRFRITSLLRTEEGQTKLSHRNGNATSHSAHLYGTTVDISYKNFYNTKKDTIECSFEAIQAMTKILTDMQQECRLLVVRERHQSCFHITVVVCKPLVNKK
jgi:uncharacterized protein YcbK (DUF882 family)